MCVCVCVPMYTYIYIYTCVCVCPCNVYVYYVVFTESPTVVGNTNSYLRYIPVVMSLISCSTGRGASSGFGVAAPDLSARVVELKGSVHFHKRLIMIDLF